MDRRGSAATPLTVKFAVAVTTLRGVPAVAALVY
jgi:hypothetical protein